MILIVQFWKVEENIIWKNYVKYVTKGKIYEYVDRMTSIWGVDMLKNEYVTLPIYGS